MKTHKEPTMHSFYNRFIQIVAHSLTLKQNFCSIKPWSFLGPHGQTNTFGLTILSYYVLSVWKDETPNNQHVVFYYVDHVSLLT